jgi:hypothetical protein
MRSVAAMIEPILFYDPIFPVDDAVIRRTADRRGTPAE